MKEFYKHSLLLILITILLFLFSDTTAQQFIILKPDKDNTLYESASGVLSNGSGSYLFAGRTAARNSGLIRRAILSFNVAENIPAGATIDSVKLTLHMSKSIADAVNVTIHHVLRNWGEGASDAVSDEGGGTTASPDDATWKYTFYDTSEWSQLGGDFDPSVLTSQSVGGVGSYTWGPNEALRQEVQSWLDNSLSNFGWIILGDESTITTAKRFDSRENATAANQPQLTIYYTPNVSSVAVQSKNIPQTFALNPNYPNPFNPSTRIDFDIAQAGDVTLTVYNILGQKVTTLFEGFLTPNSYTVEWNGQNSAQELLPSGFYFYVLGTENFFASRKMLLIR